MTDEAASNAMLDVTVRGHSFHRTANGKMTHHINGRPDHSSAGMLSTVEAFAEEIARLRQLLPSEARNQEEASPIVDPLGSRPDE